MLALRNSSLKARSATNLWLRTVNTTYKNLAEAKNDEVIEPPTFLQEPEAIPNPKIFNKSRLLDQDRNRLHDAMPYSEAHSWIHLKEKYQRKIIGKYGAASGLDPRICFKTKEDLAKLGHYEQLQEPRTLQEMVVIAKEEKAKQYEEIKKREDEIAKKLEKLEQWKNELNAKIAKKEADSSAAKERKERLIEEVRRHFGFKVDPRDERFKEMLEQKEKEDKKKQKEAKRKAKEEKMMAKLVEKTNKSETSNVAK